MAWFIFDSVETTTSVTMPLHAAQHIRKLPCRVKLQYCADYFAFFLLEFLAPGNHTAANR